jgi:hypothetical protein
MIDPISISILIVGILAGLSRFINEAHIKKLKCCFCIESDCVQKSKSKSSLTPPETPTINNETSI